MNGTWHSAPSKELSLFQANDRFLGMLIPVSERPGKDPWALTDGGTMRRLLTVAAVAAAMSIPASAAVVGFAGTAGAAGSSVQCTSLKGTITGTVTIAKCTPANPNKKIAKLYKAATGSSASLATGGNITWSGGATTTIGDTAVGGGSGQGPCKKGSTEYTFSGTVTAASTSGVGIPAVGDAISAAACVASKGGKITLAPGTVMNL